MNKRVWALVVTVVLLMGLTACGSDVRKGLTLDDGWIMRGDVGGVGENEGWYKGFTRPNDAIADVMWYANKFSASLADGERVMMSLCDLGKQVTVWLNGKQVDACEDAMGDRLVDVTDTVKRSGTNHLVIRGSIGAAVSSTTLSVRSAVVIRDLSATTEAGNMDVAITLDNGGEAADVKLTAELTALDTGKVLTRVPVEIKADKGISEHRLMLTVPDYMPWDYDNPYLYNLTVTATADTVTDTASASVGFKKLAVDAEGVYTLNGNPFMLRMVDIPQSVMQNEKDMRYFVDYVRAAEFNAINPLSEPTQALLDYADATGILVVYEGSASAHISPITVDLTTIEAVGADMQFPVIQPVDLTDKWYSDMDLDRIYGGAVDAYKAAGNLHVQQLCQAIGRVRLKNTNAIRVSGAIVGYPDSMLETINDAIEELRYVIQADSVVLTGGRLNLKVDLVDHNVLWENREFEAYIKITGDSGIVWENKVKFKTQISELGHSSRLIPLCDETVDMNVPAGQYQIAVELTNYAHPVCGEADLYVVDQVDLSGATVVNGVLPADAKAKAEAGGKVIVLNANADSNLPISGEFMNGITGGVVDNRVNVSFAGHMIPGGFGGLTFDTVFVAEGGTNVLSGFGFTNEGGLTYGGVIATYPVGSGSITVVTADADINNPTVAALLAAAIA